MNTKSKEFLKLQNTWYKKLEKQGFEDAEQLDGNLKVWESVYFVVRHQGNSFDAKAQYYRLAGQFLHEHVFKDDQEKKIWSMHADGKSIRDIAKTVKASVQKVHSRIKRLKKEMLALCK